MRPLRACLGLFGLVLFVGAWLNCAAFILIGMALGGVNAKVEGGRYYLTDHAKSTQVSECVFRYSRVHQRSVEITQPIGLLAGAGLGVLASRRHNPVQEHSGRTEASRA